MCMRNMTLGGLTHGVLLLLFMTGTTAKAITGHTDTHLWCDTNLMTEFQPCN